MQSSTRRTRSSSSLQPQRPLANVPNVRVLTTNETHHAIEDAMESTPFTRQGKKKSPSTIGIQLNNMLQNFYLKTVHTIIQSRRFTKSERVNKWFHLVVPDVNSLRAELHFWNSRVYYPCEEPPPILAIHIYLDTTHLSQKEVHKIMGNYMQQHNLHQAHDKKKIILESWSLVCRQAVSTSGISSSDLPYLYKQSIIFFRALHSFVRLLPGYSLRQLLQEDDKYSLCYRIGTGMCSYLLDELPPGSPLFKDDHRLQSTVYKFSDILTPIGTLQLKVQYRSTSPTNDTCRIETNRKTTVSQEVNNQNHPFRSTLSRSQSSPILHEQHGSSITKRMPSYNQHSSDHLLKHVPTLCISPFKSPSLSPLPQKSHSKTVSTSRSNFVPIVEKSKSYSIYYGSTSKKGEFSPSFDKYKNKITTSKHNTTDRSMDAFNLPIDQDRDLEEFVRLVNAKPNLKLFQETKWQEHLDTTCAPSDTYRNKGSTIGDNGGTLWSPLGCGDSSPCENGSLERSKSTLDYFHTLRYAHSDLSESMASDLTITNSALSTKNDSTSKEMVHNATDPYLIKRHQQRSLSTSTKSVMGTLVEEEDPSTSYA